MEKRHPHTRSYCPLVFTGHGNKGTQGRENEKGDTREIMGEPEENSVLEDR